MSTNRDLTHTRRRQRGRRLVNGVSILLGNLALNCNYYVQCVSWYQNLSLLNMLRMCSVPKRNEKQLWFTFPRQPTCRICSFHGVCKTRLRNVSRFITDLYSHFSQLTFCLVTFSSPCRHVFCVRSQIFLCVTE